MRHRDAGLRWTDRPADVLLTGLRELLCDRAQT